MRTVTSTASRTGSRRGAPGIVPRLGALVAIGLLLAACAAGASYDLGSIPEKPATGDGNGYVVGPTTPEGLPSEDQGGTPNAPSADDAKVIRTGRIELEVDGIDAAVAKARAEIVAVGGYVSGTESYDQGEKTFATIVYRIPADRWDDALAALRKLARKVVAEQTSAVEVTGQVLDLDARIRNLKATETQLLEIMTQATRIADILAVQTQLTDVQGQIEQLSTEKQHLEDQAALGTLSVSYTVPVAAVQQTQEGWDPGKEIDGALAALLGLAQGIASLAIWLVIVALPLVVLLALGFALVTTVWRRFGLHAPALRRRTPPAPPEAPVAPTAD